MVHLTGNLHEIDKPPLNQELPENSRNSIYTENQGIKAFHAIPWFCRQS